MRVDDPEQVVLPQNRLFILHQKEKVDGIVRELNFAKRLQKYCVRDILHVKPKPKPEPYVLSPWENVLGTPIMCYAAVERRWQMCDSQDQILV